MRRPLPSLVALLVVLMAGTVPAQTKQDCLITINSDGTCDAAGLHVPCGVIGPHLRQAGIAADAHIRFGLVSTANYGVISATIQSVTRAGFTNLKIGFITEPAH